MSEEFIALAILIGPLAWLVAGVIWLCRSGMPFFGFREEEDEQMTKHGTVADSTASPHEE